ncbi:PREDICTED: rhotekin-2-like isoform X2 [Branchiostoma belcheri]|uniref:Rhotekin-2-like isoform X2 n=1 Tax=Branchiostoma belcheri TaxID=7741 RepID=A0A6P4ZXJ9_BRABE|nr:PREDICTED: rhotekin-2-like isoform X2 [Branchiostoma belcheri]
MATPGKRKREVRVESPIWILRTEMAKRKEKKRKKTEEFDVVFSEKDADLQQKLDFEIKMRDGTTKLLQACKHEAQAVEAAKNLLTSNTRMMAYMSELQRRKTAEVMGKENSEATNGHLIKEPCKAKVAVSDIRIPLMWRETELSKSRGEGRRCAVFCVLKQGLNIQDTQLVHVDRTMTDITFEDIIVFEDVVHDFSLTVEVYYTVLEDDLAFASTPRKIKHKINSMSASIGKSMGKKVQAYLERSDSAPGTNPCNIGPKFHLAASVELSLRDASDSIRTHDLSVGSKDSSSHLSLYGNLCCRLAVQPRCMVEECAAGFLNLQEMVGGLPNWTRRWCVLKGPYLRTWAYPEEVEEKEPLLSLHIRQDTRVEEVDKMMMKRPNSFDVITRVSGEDQPHIFSADTREDRDTWVQALQRHFAHAEAWQQAYHCMMPIHIPTPCKLPAFLRKGSLYDDLSVDSPTKDSVEFSSEDDRISQSSLGSRGSGDEVFNTSEVMMAPPWALLFQGKAIKVTKPNATTDDQRSAEVSTKPVPAERRLVQPRTDSTSSSDSLPPVKPVPSPRSNKGTPGSASSPESGGKPREKPVPAKRQVRGTSSGSDSSSTEQSSETTAKLPRPRERGGKVSGSESSDDGSSGRGSISSGSGATNPPPKPPRVAGGSTGDR